MNEKVKVVLEFTNKKNKKKEVVFYMDKETYKVLNDQSVDEATRQRYLLDEYYFINKERKYYRKHIIEDLDKIGKEDKQHIDFSKWDNLLTEEEIKIIELIYVKGLKQVEVSALFCISKQAINKKISKIKKKIISNGLLS